MTDKKFVILGIFLPFHPSWQPRKSKFWKPTRKTPRDIIILQMCTINESYDVWFLRYGAWRTEFFVILDYFLPFYLNDNPASQNSEKMNKITHTWRRWGTPQNFLLAFIDEVWKTRKIRMLEKMKKNCWRYHHFTCVYQKP